MRLKSAKVSCLVIPILIQVLTVTCLNETIPTSSSEDLITSADPMTMKALTSSTAASTDEEIPSTTPLVEEKVSTRAKTLATNQSPKEKTTTSSEINTSAEKPVAMTTSRPKPTMTKLATEHPPTKSSKPTHHGKPIHPSESTHHGDKNTTNRTHGGHVVHRGPHSTMGYPHEPPVVNAQTKEKEEDGWQISILVVCSMLIGIVAFVVVFVIKSNREMRRRNQRRRKRAVAKKDNAFALKTIKTEEPKVMPVAEKLKKEEKRLSMHSHADPEESIPLLQLHMDGDHPVLSAPTEPQDLQPTEPPSYVKDSKPLLEENGNVVDESVA